MTMAENELSQCEIYLSNIRMYRYQEIGLKTKISPMKLYLLNLEISEKILGLIALVEIILRNKIHSELKNDRYLNKDSNVLSIEDYKTINKTMKKITGKTKSKVPRILESKIISNLTFGFWSRLFKNHKLWAKQLSRIFPKEIRSQNALTTGKINRILSNIHSLRNNIAHHERIIGKRGINIPQVLSDMQNLVSWMILDEHHQIKRKIAHDMGKKIDAILKLNSKIS
jgi:abortive infection bacteriophage resistance protein